ncbi:arginine-tRNA-protein transferase [Paraphysoderma sedebokerense]|nr:arginine-tRNA-protein transferase [Paraphysoderma sedebokerense]
MNLSIIAPTGKNVSGCGYCHSRAVGKKTSYTLGAWAYQLSCMVIYTQDYQEMIDRGWRRSGHYCYKPNLPKSCCPQYTIRLDTTKFKPSKQHRQVINRFNKFIKGEWSLPSSGTTSPLSSDTAQISQTVNSIDDEIRPDEFIPQNSSNVQMLEPASCTDEKFSLYKKYQIAIHKDTPDEVNRDSFSRFLCESPLILTYSSSSPPPTPAPDCLHPFPGYGSFHLLYYLNDQLIAVSVIDILPSCVSAVYFFYDPSYDSLSLGKLSALYEISLVRADTDGDKKVLKYYYMGFYIHRCQKMVYKAQFKPSELLDPVCENSLLKSVTNSLALRCYLEPNSILFPIFRRNIYSPL